MEAIMLVLHHHGMTIWFTVFINIGIDNENDLIGFTTEDNYNVSLDGKIWRKF